MKTIGRCMMKISFFVWLAILIGGYFIYGSIVSKISGPDDRVPPAVSMEDGVDYVVMLTWRIFLIQLLNIAGLGPIWGTIGGAMWGPASSYGLLSVPYSRAVSMISLQDSCQ